MRALTLLIAASLATAINRGVQPYWRRISNDRLRELGIADVVTLTLGFSICVFGTVGAVALPLYSIWLGPGWELAANVSIVLAAGCIFQVPAAVMASSLEMYGRFAVIRLSQVTSVFVMVPFLVLTVLKSSLTIGAFAVPASQLAAFCTLVACSKLQDRCFSKRRIKSLMAQIGISLLPVAFSAWAFVLYEDLSVDNKVPDSSLFHVIFVLLVALVMNIVVLPFSPMLRIALRRGLVPASIRKLVL